MTGACSVYLFGYPHARFGHVVKVGISANPAARLSTIQSTNPDTVIPHFEFEFRSRSLARSIEGRFHERFSHYGIRGEWFGMGDGHALFMLSMEVVRALAGQYPPEVISVVRRECGLLRAFEILDREPEERHDAWNAEWMSVEEAFA